MHEAERAAHHIRLRAGQAQRDVHVMDQEIGRNARLDVRHIWRVPTRHDVPRLCRGRERRQEGGIEAFEQAAHERDVDVRGQRDERLHLGEVVGDRLLDQERQPGIEHAPADRRV
jgi:hypothetical protein